MNVDVHRGLIGNGCVISNSTSDFSSAMEDLRFLCLYFSANSQGTI